MLHGLVGLIAFWSRLSDRYNRICSEGSAEKSVYFGVRAIISMVFSALLMVGIVAGVFYTLMLMDSLLVIFAIIIAIVLGLGGIVVMIIGVIGSLICVIYQLRLNRGPMGWIALVVWIGLLAATVWAIIYVLSLINGI